MSNALSGASRHRSCGRCAKVATPEKLKSIDAPYFAAVWRRVQVSSSSFLVVKWGGAAVRTPVLGPFGTASSMRRCSGRSSHSQRKRSKHQHRHDKSERGPALRLHSRAEAPAEGRLLSAPAPARLYFSALTPQICAAAAPAKVCSSRSRILGACGGAYSTAKDGEENMAAES